MFKNFYSKNGRLFLVFIVLIAFGFYSFAGEGTKYSSNGEKKESLNLALGYVYLSGNAKSETGSFKVDYCLAVNRIFLEAKTYFIFTDVTDVSTGHTTRIDEKYFFGLKSNYMLGKKSGIFANVSWLKNKPAGINKNLAIATGYSRILVDNDKKKSKFGIGVEGYKEEKIIGNLLEDDSFVAAYFEFAFQYAFNEANKIKFENETRVNFSDSDDYRLLDNLSYSSAINKKMAIEFNYIHQYRNIPVPGKKKTDTTLMINLVFKF